MRCPEMTALPWRVIVQCERIHPHGPLHSATVYAPTGDVVEVNWRRHQQEEE